MCDAAKRSKLRFISHTTGIESYFFEETNQILKKCIPEKVNMPICNSDN
jgi:hypothetical protein